MSIKQLPQTNTTNHTTMLFLRANGYPIWSIRNALVVLAGMKHDQIAQSIGKSRSAVTNAINMALGGDDTLRAIARMLQVPVEELFADNRRFAAGQACAPEEQGSKSGAAGEV